MIFVVMIGGLGSVEGPILGTVIYIAMHQWLGDFDTAYLILLGVLLTRVVPQLRRRHHNVDLSAAEPAHTEAIQ
jgi:ABC-type branched-subunit amino acid transport system permease subunit